jgi:hypothetical protein
LRRAAAEILASGASVTISDQGCRMSGFAGRRRSKG